MQIAVMPAEKISEYEPVLAELVASFFVQQ
jgi:hypothetical protein